MTDLREQVARLISDEPAALEQADRILAIPEIADGLKLQAERRKAHSEETWDDSYIRGMASVEEREAL